MLKTQLVAGRNKTELRSHDGFDGEPILSVTTYKATYGRFKTGTANNGTSTIVTPGGDGALVLTDLIVTSDKLNNGTITVDFYDGTYTEILLKGNIDFGLTLAIPFQGHWEGWSSADIRLTCSGATDAYIAVGYFKIPWDKALSYAEWDKLR